MILRAGQIFCPTLKGFAGKKVVSHLFVSKRRLMGRKKCLNDDVEKEALSVAGVEGGEYMICTVHCTVVQTVQIYKRTVFSKR